MKYKKFKLFSGESILLGLKALGTSIIAGISISLLIALANFIRNKLPMVGLLILMIIFVLNLFLWGYIANRVFKIR